MTDKELRKLSRAELLEMLLVQGKTMEKLQARLDEAEKQLQDRLIRIQEAGSVAEASLQLGGLFEAAQQSADIYLANIKQLDEESRQRRAEADRLYAETQAKCQALEEETRQKCDKMICQAEEDAHHCWMEISQQLESCILPQDTKEQP